MPVVAVNPDVAVLALDLVVVVLALDPDVLPVFAPPLEGPESAVASEPPPLEEQAAASPNVPTTLNTNPVRTFGLPIKLHIVGGQARTTQHLFF